MKTFYFNITDGSVLTDNQIAGEEALIQGNALKAEAPENISSWRLKLNILTKEVIIYGGANKTEEQALQQKEQEAIELKRIEKEAADLDMKQKLATSARAAELRKQLLNSI